MKNFSRCLALGFSLLFASPALAKPGLSPTFYALGALGTQSTGYEDLDRYFDYRGYGYGKPDFQTTAALVGDLGAGYQFANRLGLEAGMNFGPARSIRFVSPLSGGPSQSRRWESSVSTLYFMPALRLPGEDGLLAGVVLHTIGLKLGIAFFRGHREDTNQLNGVSGSYDQSASAAAFGLCYRFDQMVNDRASLGLELGYNLLHFDRISVDNLSGNTSPASPEKNPDGSSASFDFSGPSLKLVLTGWWERPFRREKD